MIRRCPYCKAIIDEQDKYCNNCGTQLLFPEDEYVDEEIPGDRIVEEPEEEGKEAEELEEKEDLEEPEPAEEDLKEKQQKEEEEVEDEEHEEEQEEEEETDDLEEAEEEEGEEEEEEEAEEGEEEEEREEETAEEFKLESAEAEPEEEEEDVEEIESPTREVGTGDPAMNQPQVDDSHGKYKVSIEEDELVFKTKELGVEIPPPFAEKDKKAPTTGLILPPWAKGMKEEPVQPDDLEKSKREVIEAEAEPGTTPTRPDWAADSGIGIPEKITQAGLPFGTAAIPATAELREEAAEEAAEEAGAETRPRSRLQLKLRSKLVDLVFITALWVISLWFTAQVIGVSFLRLIVGSPAPVLAFYFILLLLYFFLFLYFLGETLGDHFFSEED